MLAIYGLLAAAIVRISSLLCAARARAPSRCNAPFGKLRKAFVERRSRLKNAEKASVNLRLPGRAYARGFGRQVEASDLGASQAGSASVRQLRSRVPKLSDKVLTERLRDLEEQGLVRHRNVGGDQTYAVYELTDRGKSLSPVLDALTPGAKRPRWTSA